MEAFLAITIRNLGRNHRSFQRRLQSRGGAHHTLPHCVRDQPTIETPGHLLADAHSGRRTEFRSEGSNNHVQACLYASFARPPAFEAQQSRYKNDKSSTQRLSRQTNATKEIAAFCAAETYHLPTAAKLLTQHGFRPNPIHTGLESQVLHVQTPAHSEGVEAAEAMQRAAGDVFVFPAGSVVAWNVSSALSNHIVHDILISAAENSHSQIEIENFAYIEVDTSSTSKIIGDIICLGTSSNNALNLPSDRDNHKHANVTLAQIAYSSALARSTKLAVLEALLSSYFNTTRNIASTLSSGTALPFTRSFILRKTGELLSIRAQLNLYSELTDSLPDLFWDSPHELGLEDYYESLGRALDVGVRIRVLNQKMDYASEIAAVLRERLSEKHSTGLEWLIIGLISIEVAFGVFHLVKENQEHEELSRVRDLLERYLELEISGKQTKRD